MGSVVQIMARLLASSDDPGRHRLGPGKRASDREQQLQQIMKDKRSRDNVGCRSEWVGKGRVCKRSAVSERFWRARGRYSICGLEGFSTMVFHRAPCKRHICVPNRKRAHHARAGQGSTARDHRTGRRSLAGFSVGGRGTWEPAHASPKRHGRVGSTTFSARSDSTPPRLGASRHIAAPVALRSPGDVLSACPGALGLTPRPACA
ncbi:hypothetical protein BKA63DRAFT_589473 [Paraphoma chrysanthemicola]|nr:hypothetical protein BKA63DRAFT_589473 [Paraphoma chrysanthemicola]